MGHVADSQEIVSGPPHVHHMDSNTAYHSAKLGMWLFLATEILLFGGLFTGFAIYRYLKLEAFTEAATYLDWRMGAVNTAVLIFSSFTAVLAMDAAQHGDNAKVRRNLLITISCGFGFLLIKFFEYKSKAQHGLFPGDEAGFATCMIVMAIFFAITLFILTVATKYKGKKGALVSGVVSLAIILFFWFFADNLAGIHFDIANLFGHKEHKDLGMVFNDANFNNSFGPYFGLYYCMTGLHALHVVIGMGILYWVYIKACADRFSTDYYTPVEVGALYWHLVDLIWIYLFPLLYLVG